MPASMAHRVTFGVDIEGYSKRRDPEQVELQARLCWITKEALKAAGVKARQCERQNQGDGQLISLPQVIDMKSVLPALPLAMQAAIHRVNAVPSPAGQLRMRMSIAQGPVQTASTGYVGPGVIAASRMLDSQLLRDTLRDNTGADLVLMVTDDLYQQVYRQGYSGLAAPGFRDAQLENKAKNYAARVWIYVASGPPDTKLVPAFAGTGTPGGNVAAMWDVAIPAAGIGVAMWVHQHDAHQHDAHQHDAHQHHDHLEAHQPELGHLVGYDAHDTAHPVDDAPWTHDPGHDYQYDDQHLHHDTAWHDHAGLPDSTLTDPGSYGSDATDGMYLDSGDPGGW